MRAATAALNAAARRVGPAYDGFAPSRAVRLKAPLLRPFQQDTGQHFLTGVLAPTGTQRAVSVNGRRAARSIAASVRP